jgi:hypothetical protein
MVSRDVCKSNLVEIDSGTGYLDASRRLRVSMSSWGRVSGKNEIPVRVDMTWDAQ